jgi:hypothetical protein
MAETQTAGFLDRAAVRRGGGFRYATGFPRLQWALFVRRTKRRRGGR